MGIIALREDRDHPKLFSCTHSIWTLPPKSGYWPIVAFSYPVYHCSHNPTASLARTSQFLKPANSLWPVSARIRAVKYLLPRGYRTASEHNPTICHSLSEDVHPSLADLLWRKSGATARRKEGFVTTFWITTGQDKEGCLPGAE